MSNMMRWNCDLSGCFNLKCRPKIDQFYDCFPGRIGMGDVDGVVEVNACFFLLEWKSVADTLSMGQAILHRRLVANGGDIDRFVVAIVVGNAETMSVSHMDIVTAVALDNAWTPADLEDVKGVMRRWAAWAKYADKRTNPRFLWREND